MRGLGAVLMSLTRLARAIGLVAMSAVAAGCGGGGGSGTSAAIASSSSASSTSSSTVSTAATSASPKVVIGASPGVMALGETATLSATLVDAAGAVVTGTTPTWSGSDDTVATVSPAGLVSALRQGTVTLTAAAGGQSTTTRLDVAWAVADVDFATHTNMTLTSGLLHGFGFGPTSDHPPDSRVTPLGIGYWRSIPDVVAPLDASRLGARYDIVLSDLWGYPTDGWPHGKPWLNLSAYSDFVTQTARQLQGSVVYWEIWNEPAGVDGNPFWDGTEAQFFQTYLTAYRALRSVLGTNALIVGPSISGEDEGFLDRFAAYCIAQHCEANVLSWHETDAPGPDLATRAISARTRYGAASSNAALNVKQIHVNEYGSPSATHKPVDSLLYLQYLEKGGVDAVARACWTDSQGAGECYNDTLGGLLVPTTYLTRSVWHAYRLYAQGAAGRVVSWPSQPQLLALASVTAGTASTSPSTMAAQVLVGAANGAVLPTAPKIGVRLHGLSAIAVLAGSTQVSAVLMKVSNSEEAASAGPVVAVQQTVKVQGGATSVLIDAAEAGALYQLVLSN